MSNTVKHLQKIKLFNCYYCVQQFSAYNVLNGSKKQKNYINGDYKFILHSFPVYEASFC